MAASQYVELDLTADVALQIHARRALTTRTRLDPDTGCTLWQGWRNASGYGCVSYRGRTYGAHRLAYALAHGTVPAGACVLHRCDTPACVNDGHLYAGTQAENNRDRMAKHRSATGERSGRSKLTAQDVADMRRDYAGGAIVLRDLAKRYGVDKSTAALAVTGATWADVDVPPCKLWGRGRRSGRSVAVRA
jgi:hypothetical protein